MSAVYTNIDVKLVERPIPLDRTASGGTFEGRGFSASHHGEILQGVFEHVAVPVGRLRRALITIPCHLFHSKVTFSLDPGTAPLTVHPKTKVKALRAATLAFERYGAPVELGGRLTVISDVPEGWGAGSSTADVVASIYAVADAFGKRPIPEDVGKLAVAAEIASDAIMFDQRAVLFAHREGIVLEDLGGPLPPLSIVGFNSEEKGVPTLGLPPVRYTSWEIEAFRPLLGLVRRAIQFQDPRLLGRVASASARLNQRHLPKPRFDLIERVAQKVGALGISVAHSGTLIGLLFDPEDRETRRRTERAGSLLNKLGVDAWHFSTAENKGMAA